MRTERDDWYWAERSKYLLKRDGFTPAVQRAMIAQMEKDMVQLGLPQRANTQDNGARCASGHHVWQWIDYTDREVDDYTHTCINCGVCTRDDD